MRMPSQLLTEDGLPKLASWSFASKNTMLLQPADFLAYATTQVYRDFNSERARICMPIVGDENALVMGKVLSGHEVRSIMQLTQALIQASRIKKRDLFPQTDEQFNKFSTLIQKTIYGERK